MSDSSMDIWSKCHFKASISIVGYGIFFFKKFNKNTYIACGNHSLRKATSN